MKRKFIWLAPTNENMKLFHNYAKKGKNMSTIWEMEREYG